MKPSAKKKFALTPRETDVAREVLIGTARKTIADRLRITVWTVDKHIRSIRKKTGVPTRLEAGYILSHYKV